MNAYFSAQLSRALNASALLPARSSLISLISAENSGTNSTTPSGITTTPKLFPFAALFYSICDIICDLRQRLFLSLYFLRDQADVRLALQCTLKCYVRSTTSHNFDEMPVLLSGVTVSLDVSDKLAVSLGCSIKTKGNLDILILKVSVDGLRASDYLYAGLMCCHVLSKYTCIGVGIITTDDNDCGDTMFLQTSVAILNCSSVSSLVLPGTDDIESTGISVLVDICIIKYDEIVFDQSAWTTFETNQNILFIGCLQRIIQTTYNIVSAWCLSAGKDNTYYLFLSCRSVLSFFKGNLRLAIKYSGTAQRSSPDLLHLWSSRLL